MQSFNPLFEQLFFRENSLPGELTVRPSKDRNGLVVERITAKESQKNLKRVVEYVNSEKFQTDLTQIENLEHAQTLIENLKRLEKKCLSYFITKHPNKKKTNGPSPHHFIDPKVIRAAEEKLAEITPPPWETALKTLKKYIIKTSNLKENFDPQKTTELNRLTWKPNLMRNKTLMGHIHADLFLKGSGLEGSNTADNLDYVSKYIQEQHFDQNNPDFTRLTKLFEEAKGFFKIFSTPIAFEEKKKKYCEYVQNKIQLLEIDQSFLIPGGWTSRDSGHSMWYEATRQENGKFRFTIYNSGAGISRHVLGLCDSRMKHIPKLQIADISKDDLCDRQVLSAIFELKTQKSNTEGLDTEYNAYDIYEGILPLLHGSKVDFPENPPREMFTTPQESGTCSWKALVTVLRTHLSYPDFKRLSYGIKKQSLIDFFFEHKDTLKDDEVARCLIQKSGEKFCNNLISLARRNIISLEELQQDSDIIQHILHRVSLAEQSYRYDFCCTLKEYPEGKAREVYPASQPIDNFPIFDSIGEVSSFEKVENKPALLPLKYKPMTFPSPQGEIAIYERELSPLTITTNLEHFYHDAKTAFAKGNYEALYHDTQTLFDKMPIPRPNDKFWSAIPPEERSRSIEPLLGVNEIFMKCCFEMPQGKYQHIENVILTHKALAIHHFLLGLEDPSMAKIPLGEEFAETFPKNIFFAPVNARQKQEIKELKNYYDSLAITLYDLGLGEMRNYKYCHFFETGAPILSPESATFMGHSHLTHVITKDSMDTDEWSDGYSDRRADREILYLCKLLRENKKIREKLFTKYPECESLPIYLQAAYASCDLKGEILPKTYCRLKKHALIKNYCFWGPFYKPRGQTNFANTFAFDLKPKQIRINESVEVEYTINGMDNSIFNQHPQLKLIGKEQYNESLSHFAHNTFLNPRPEPHDPQLKKILHKFKESDFNQNTLLAGKPESYHFTNHEEFRELCLAISYASSSGKNYERKKHPLFIPRLVSYFSKHMNKLESSDYQSFFELILFDEDHLKNYLAINPEFTKTLSDFTHSLYDFYLTQNNLSAILFSLRLEKQVQEHLVDVNKDAPPNKKQDSLPNRLPLLKKLLTQRSSRQEKSLLCESILENYQNRLPQDHIQEFLEYFMHYHTYTLPEGDQDLSRRESIDHLFFKYGHQIKKNFSKEDPNNTLNGILSFLIPDAKPMNWEGSFPLFSSGNDQYSINLAEGKLYQKGDVLAPLPNRILKNDNFGVLFGKKEYLGRLISRDTYEFQDDKQHLFRIRLIGHDNTEIQRMVNGCWYQWISPRQLIWTPPEKVIPKRREGLAYGKENNHTRHESSRSLSYSDDKKTMLEPAAVHEEEPVSFLGSQHLIDAYSHWLSCDPSPTGMEMLLFPTQGKQKREYRILIEKKKNGLAVKKIQDLRKTHKALLLSDIYNNKSVWDFFSPFEKLPFVHVWKDKHGAPQKIELPRFELSFTVDSEKRIQCDQVSGFFLSTKQAVPYLQDFPNFLLLENTNGKQVCIIPRQRIAEATAAERGSLTTKMRLEQNPEDTTPYLSYEVKNSGHLTASKPEHAIYLTYLLLGKKRYQEAFGILRKYGEKNRAYTKNEKETLEWILNLKKQNEDAFPQANAIRCLAYYFLRSNEKTYESTLEKTPRQREVEKNQRKQAGQFYSIYINLRQQMSPCKLYPNEELFLLDILPLNSMLRKNRLAELSPARGPTEINTLQNPIPDRNDSKDFELFWTNLSSFLNMTYDEATKPQQTYLFTRPGKTFHKQFRNNYRYAKGGSEIEKEMLRKRLSLMKGEKYPYNKSLRMFLEMVLQKPNKFPSPASFFKEIQQNHYWEYDPTKASDFTSEIHRQIYNACKKTYPAPKVKFSEKPFFQFTTPSPLAVLDETSKLQLDPNRAIIHVTPSKRPQISTKSTEEEYFARERDLKIELAEQNKLLLRQEQTLLDAANVLPPDTLRQLTVKLAETGKRKTPVTIEDLIASFIQQDSFHIAEKNPILTKEQLNILNDLTCAYLLRATHMDQIKRSLHILSEREDWIASHPDYTSTDPIHQEIIDRFNQEISKERGYDPINHPEFLVFEYFSNMLLRKDQALNLEKFQTNKDEPPNNILHIIMGSGKTKILLPILALQKADGNRLPVFVIPESLYEVTTQDLHHSTLEAFQQKSYTLHIDRQQKFSPENLKEIYQLLERACQERKYLIMTPKSLHCLALKFQEALYDYAHGDEAAYQNIEELRKILHFLKTKGHTVIDEADTVLNCRHEVNFTIGTNPEPLPDDQINLVVMLYRTLATSSDIAATANIDFLGRHTEGVPPLTVYPYNSQIKPLLLNELLNEFTKLPKKAPMWKLGQWIQALDDSQKENLQRYLCGKTSAQETNSEALMEKSGEELVANCKEFRDLLSLLKDELQTVLPHTLNKNCYEHYGFSKLPGKVLAKPYIASNINEKSDHGNPYALMNYTIQVYCLKGIPLHAIESHLKMLKGKAEQEHFQDRAVPLAETDAYKAFLDLCHEMSLSPPPLLLSLHPEDIETITDKINGNIQSRLKYVERYILPNIQIYDQKFSSNSQSLVELFSNVQGFEGTPWNKETFHPKLRTEENPEVDNRTLSLFESGKKGQTIHSVQSADPSKVLNELFSKKDPKIRALIDTGALCRGINNATVARWIFEKASTCKGVIYFNDHNEPVILEKGKKKPIPLEESSIPQEDRFTYYDQRHTTGVDLPQDPFAKAYFTVSKTTILRDLLQGVWRMRGLEKNQDIEFILPPDARLIIQQSQEISPNDNLNTHDILQFVSKNQEHIKKKNNFVALQQMMANVIQQKIMALFLEGGLSKEEYKTLFLATKSFLVRSIIKSPFELHGRRLEELSAPTVVQGIIESYIQEFKKAIQRSPLLSTWSAEQLKTEFEKLVNYEQLPETLPSYSSEPLESEHEIEAEKEQEKEIQKEQHLEIEQDIFEKTPKPCETWAWRIPPLEKQSFLQEREGTLFLPSKIDELVRENPSRKDFSRPPFIPITEIFPAKPALKDFADIFDARIHISSNFFHIASASKDALDMLHPFGPYQLPVQQIFVIYDKQSKKKMITLINQTDAIAFAKLLKKDKEYRTKKRRKSYCLYDPFLGVVETGKEAISTDRLKSDEDFLSLITQIKFLDGELYYSKKEQAYLKKWLQEKGTARMEILFTKHILRYRPNAKASYPNSTIASIFSSSE